jgi:pimeloyl-ACP methyl ester carboxylesterase
MDATTGGPQSRYYHSQGLRLHFTDWGNPQAPPLLLVHGGLDHSRSWDRLAQALRRNFHVVAPDLRGHGESEWATGSSYSLADHVYDLTGLVKAAGLEKVSIVGHSMGGMVSLTYAGAFPEEVSRLVAGREYVEAIAPALSDIRNAALAVADHSRKPTGTLRFSCSLGGGRQLLMPFVFEYLRRYDRMKVEIVTEGRLIDIIKDGFDAAGVRLAEAVPQDMIAVPLGPDARHVVVGAPSYFANKSRPTAPADLMDHECIRARYSSGALYRWEFERHGEAMRIDVPGSLTLDEPDMMAQASRAGVCPENSNTGIVMVKSAENGV